MTGADGAPLIGLVDYGVGNRRSMEKSLLRAGARVELTADHARLRAAGGIVLPGVGAFRRGMDLLRARGLDELLRERAAAGVAILGVCLGMQLLFEASEEHGDSDGLGLLGGVVRPLESGGLNLPHIGWNAVRWVRPTPLRAGLADGAPFYHVHSFAPRPTDPNAVLATGDYGAEFATVVGSANVMGTQFHPEKSSRDGIALLANFVALCNHAEGQHR